MIVVISWLSCFINWAEPHSRFFTCSSMGLKITQTCNDVIVSCRAANGLKPGALAAITAPPAASSPGLVPLAVWLQPQKVKQQLIQQNCTVLLGPCPHLSPFTAVFMSPCVCIYVFGWHLLNGSCKIDTPLYSHIYPLWMKLLKKEQLCNQLGIFYCEFFIPFIYQQ